MASLGMPPMVEVPVGVRVLLGGIAGVLADV